MWRLTWVMCPQGTDAKACQQRGHEPVTNASAPEPQGQGLPALGFQA